MTYTAHFLGRRKGAIGIFQNFQVTVIASNYDDARLKLYETHQDILQCVIVKKEN